MPTPHFDAIIAALNQPGFFAENAARSTAAAQAKSYATILTQNFSQRADKDAIDAALALGVYLWHSEVNKKQRLILRAVLLAHILLKNEPIANIPFLRLRYESLAFDALKRAFVSVFPLPDDTARLLWNPDYFTLPIELAELRTEQDWRHQRVPDYMFIVHGSDDPSKVLWQDPVKEVEKYSGSSMTLMSNEKPYIYQAVGMVQGVIFKVPAKNILVTYRADLMSVLRAGTVKNPGAGTLTFGEEIIELAAASGALLSPRQLLRLTNRTDQGPSVSGVLNKYNEIVVCGKPGVPLPWGVTEKLKLVGMFMQITKAGALLGGNAPQRKIDIEAHAKRLRCPLLFLPNEP
jgi:hypothetical protein